VAVADGSQPWDLAGGWCGSYCHFANSFICNAISLDEGIPTGSPLSNRALYAGYTVLASCGGRHLPRVGGNATIARSEKWRKRLSEKSQHGISTPTNPDEGGSNVHTIFSRIRLGRPAPKSQLSTNSCSPFACAMLRENGPKSNVLQWQSQLADSDPSFQQCFHPTKIASGPFRL
jgi:hypothetical protein